LARNPRCRDRGAREPSDVRPSRCARCWPRKSGERIESAAQEEPRSGLNRVRASSDLARQDLGETFLFGDALGQLLLDVSAKLRRIPELERARLRDLSRRMPSPHQPYGAEADAEDFAV